MAVAKNKKLRRFDRALGRVIASKRKLKDVSQAELAEAAGLALSLMGRVEAGTRSLTVAELEMFAERLGIPAGVIAQEAVDEYGGIELLVSEARGTHIDYEAARGDVALAAQNRDEESDQPEDFE